MSVSRPSVRVSAAAALLALLCSLWRGESASAAQIKMEIGSAKKSLEILPPPGAKKSKKSDKPRSRLLQVIPLRGNNPFNPREPINNRDGRIVLPERPGGGGRPQGGAAPPAPRFPISIQYADIGGNRYGATMIINQADDSAVLQRGIVASPDGVQFVIDNRTETSTVSPAPGSNYIGGGGPFRLGAERPVMVRHAITGVRYQITYANNVAVVPPVLTVISMTRIGG